MGSPGEIPQEFWEMVERYRGDLVNQALSIVGNLEDADDVVQESFCEAYMQREKLADVRSLGAWLRSINKSNALDRLRKVRRNSRKLQRKQQEAPEDLSTTGGLRVVELRESVAKAVESLPEEIREAVVLCYWEHRSLDEIAQRMSISRSTVRRLLYEASTLLYGKLEIHMDNRGPGH